MDKPQPYFAVVRRDNAEVFDFLWQRFQGPRLVQVIWDRRRDDRRAASEPVPQERRRADRREPTPLSWQTLGFTIAPWSGRGGAPGVTPTGTPPSR